jgi:mono/diheme cytochrome c family protein
MKKILVFVLIIIMPACSKKIIPPGETVKPLSEASLKGQAVFMQRCNRCHPGGMAGLGPSIFNKPLPGFLIRFQVRAGLGAMPAFNKNSLPDNQLNDLIFYIKEMKKH